MSGIWSREYWKATGQLVARGAAAGGLLQLGVQFGDVFRTGAINAFDITWALPGYILGGALVSLLFCIAGNVQSGTGPSFGDSMIVPPTDPAVRAARDLPPASPETRFGT